MSREISLKALDAKGVQINARVTDSKGSTTVLFIHGNCSSSLYWQETLRALPERFTGIAPDLRGYGASEAAPVDATRGLRDFSDDVYHYAAAHDLVGGGRKVALVGHSVGGGVAMQFAIDHPDAVSAIVLEDPVSPFGFGGTRDANGTPCWDDFAGSGGGTANPDFVKRLAERDRTADAPNSPRNVLNTFFVKPPFKSPQEEALLDSVLSTVVGEKNYPGDMTQSPNWPAVAPGRWGMNNAISAKYLDLSAFANVAPKPPVLWIHGADDQIVSDTSFFDFGYLGQLGFVPGWPGVEKYPPQPMVSQIRALLDRYAANGGSYRFAGVADCGHSPHIEKAAEFERLAYGFLAEHG